MKYPTQEYLLENFTYNPESGYVTRNKVAGGKLIGSRAGYVNSSGYRSITIKRKEYLEHRVIWLMNTGDDADNIDHINHIRSDNRLVNIRSVTQKDNDKNKKLDKRSSTGFTGISWAAQNNKFKAQITVNKKRIFLGYHQTLIDAAAARIKANRKHEFHTNHGK